MTSQTTPSFWKMYYNLSPDARIAARQAFQKFRQDQSHPSLHVERLRSDPRAWSVRISSNYRAVANRRDDIWMWVWIGTHQEFDRKFKT